MRVGMHATIGRAAMAGPVWDINLVGCPLPHHLLQANISFCGGALSASTTLSRSRDRIHPIQPHSTSQKRNIGGKTPNPANSWLNFR